MNKLTLAPQIEDDVHNVEDAKTYMDKTEMCPFLGICPIDNKTGEFLSCDECVNKYFDESYKEDCNSHIIMGDIDPNFVNPPLSEEELQDAVEIQETIFNGFTKPLMSIMTDAQFVQIMKEVKEYVKKKGWGGDVETQINDLIKLYSKDGDNDGEK